MFDDIEMVKSRVVVDRELMFMLSWARTVSSINNIYFPVNDLNRLRREISIGETMNSFDYNYRDMLVSCYMVSKLKTIFKSPVYDKYMMVLNDKIESTMYIPSQFLS